MLAPKGNPRYASARRYADPEARNLGIEYFKPSTLRFQVFDRSVGESN